MRRILEFLQVCNPVMDRDVQGEFLNQDLQSTQLNAKSVERGDGHLQQKKKYFSSLEGVFSKISIEG